MKISRPSRGQPLRTRCVKISNSELNVDSCQCGPIGIRPAPAAPRSRDDANVCEPPRGPGDVAGWSDGRIAVRPGSTRCGSRRGTGGLANDKRCRFVSGATSSHCSASGKTKTDQKTRKRGRAIVRGGIGTGTRTVGMLGAVLTYARENGIIETNPAPGSWHSKAGLSEANPASVRGRISAPLKTAAQGRAGRSTRHSGGDRQSRRSHRLSPRRNHQSHLAGSGYRQQLPAPD